MSKSYIPICKIIKKVMTFSLLCVLKIQKKKIKDFFAFHFIPLIQ